MADGGRHFWHRQRPVLPTINQSNSVSYEVARCEVDTNYYSTFLFQSIVNFSTPTKSFTHFKKLEGMTYMIFYNQFTLY